MRRPHTFKPVIPAKAGIQVGWWVCAGRAQNQALGAILFLYKVVLGRDPGWLDDVVRAKRPQRLPVVLTRPEVEALLRVLS